MKLSDQTAGIRLRDTFYEKDHLVNRDNMEDSWCGRPLNMRPARPSRRTASASLCRRCRVDDEAWLERDRFRRLHDKGLRYGPDPGPKP